MQSIAELLISNDFIQLSPAKPFHYASGLKGPIYCDNRLALSRILVRAEILNVWAQELFNQRDQFDVLGGLATAGIPWASMLADRLNLPLIYVRGKPKEHGKQNQIEGGYRPGQRVLLIEDLVNQGKSLQEAIDGCLKAELKVVGAYSIVDYQMKASFELLQKYQIPLYPLTNFSEIIQVALTLDKISKEDAQLLLKWQADPVNWAKNAE